MCKGTRCLWLSKTHMRKVTWLTEHTYVWKLDNSTRQATYWVACFRNHWWREKQQVLYILSVCL
jgi:hypothetical protein